jgi:hypothetical protein
VCNTLCRDSGTPLWVKMGVGVGGMGFFGFSSV